LVEEQKRIAQEKALAKKREERQQAEAEKKRLAEEQRKKAEAEKKRKEEERRQRELAAALAAEEKARTEAARREHDQSEINKYIKLIRTQIGNTFNYPERGLSCELLVTMVPGGDVVDAKVIRSSGNAVFDRQAEIAVRKASPLPVPDDPRLFRQLREIQFVFEPEV
ncbi:MAG: cell envelope integrity protein TolA, partial [Pseudomonadota bacterium]|nr:cell envelope integrity protein TolA [Pseudomonadota bacterium]